MRRVPLATIALALVACRARDTANRDDANDDLACTAPAAPETLTPELGTPHPIDVVALGPNGRWAIACQARADTTGDGRIDTSRYIDEYRDQLLPYLFRTDDLTQQWTSTSGELLDAVIDESADGRWLAVVRDHVLVVLDMESGAEQAIPHAALHALRGREGNIARFVGQSIVYFAEPRRRIDFGPAPRVDPPGWLVARDLRSGIEVVAHPSAPIADMQRERGPWLALWQYVVPARGYRVYADQPVRSAAPYICKPEHDAWRPVPHEQERANAWFNTVTGEYVDDPTVLAHLDGEALRQAATGQIVLGAAEIVPRDCAAKLRAISASPPRVVAACQRPGASLSLEMFGPGIHTVFDPQGPDDQRNWYHDDRFAQLHQLVNARYYCQWRSACFELATGRRIAAPGDIHDVYTGAAGDYIVSDFAHGHFATNAQTGTTTPLLPLLPRELRPTAAIPHHRMRVHDLIVDFDLAPPRAIYELADADAGVDTDGYVLTGIIPPSSLDSPLPLGPLHWIVP